MLGFNRFVGGLHCNSVRPSVAISYLPHIFKWGGRGGFPNNLVTQVTMYLIIVFNIFNIDKSFAKPNVNVYKQEYFKQLDYNFDQFHCVNDLVTKESNYNPLAKNGSHYGLPQGRSKYLKTATYKQQITWHIKYLKHRYGTDRLGTANACGAWAHWLMKGWH